MLLNFTLLEWTMKANMFVSLETSGSYRDPVDHYIFYVFCV